MEEEAPIVFISYSHDSSSHKEWVLNLATKLQENGLSIILDEWDLKLGGDLAKFMENGLTQSQRVLLVCTDKYIEKSDSGKGGVGYEKMIVTSELMENLDTHKFIPVVRKVTLTKKVPLFMGGRLFIDFSDDDKFEEKLEELLREIHGSPENKKPEIGKNPFKSESKDTITNTFDDEKSDKFNNSDVKKKTSENDDIGNTKIWWPNTNTQWFITIIITILGIIPGWYALSHNKETKIASSKNCYELDDIEIEVGKTKIIEGTGAFVELTQADEEVCTFIINDNPYELDSSNSKNLLLDNCKYILRRVSYDSYTSSCKMSITKEDI